MTTLEIRSLLNESIGGTVHVVWNDGTEEDVKVISVDEEGFVYDLVPPDPNTPYWNPFEDIGKLMP